MKQTSFWTQVQRFFYRNSDMACDKNYISQSKYELKQDVDTNLGTANIHLVQTESFVMLALLPFRDHHALLTISLTTADTNDFVVGLPFLQKYRKIIDIKLSGLLPEFIIHNQTLLKLMPFLKNSQKQQPFYSKFLKLKVEKANCFSSRPVPVFNFFLKETKATFKTFLASFLLLHRSYDQMSFTETCYPNPQARKPSFILKIKMVNPITFPSDNFSYIYLSKKILT